jgi:hypothetical protein
MISGARHDFSGWHWKIDDTLPPALPCQQKLALSFSLAQSAKLFVFEDRVDTTISSARHIPVSLAERGRIDLSRTEISKLTGKVFLERNEVNLHSDILVGLSARELVSWLLLGLSVLILTEPTEPFRERSLEGCVPIVGHVGFWIRDPAPRLTVVGGCCLVWQDTPEFFWEADVSATFAGLSPDSPVDLSSSTDSLFSCWVSGSHK